MNDVVEIAATDGVAGVAAAAAATPAAGGALALDGAGTGTGVSGLDAWCSRKHLLHMFAVALRPKKPQPLAHGMGSDEFSVDIGAVCDARALEEQHSTSTRCDGTFTRSLLVPPIQIGIPACRVAASPYHYLSTRAILIYRYLE